ncbi:hypothetical protein BGW37DRAFT_520498 [Umbelopsis sp. PMI_123]|nr:hypothetical protein BGW37DRAFT_520498 [Umbelopsis sp. PMI_123]
MSPDTQIPNIQSTSAADALPNSLAVPEDTPQLVRKTTLTPISEQEYPNSVPSTLPNSINSSDEEDNIERIRTNALSRRSSLSSGISNPVPLTHRASRMSTASNATSHSRWRLRTPRNSIYTVSSLVSRPPSYKRFDPLDHQTNDESAAHEGSHMGGWKGLLSQFSGIYFAFWVVILAFVGAVAVIVPELPQIALLMWIPLAAYLTVAGYLYYRRRKERQAIEAAEPERERRESRLRELLHAMRLPDNYFFVIDNQKEHHHPVVTLLPPPPTYRNNNNPNQQQPIISEVPPTPPTTDPNRHEEDEDYVRINLHGLIDAEHRDEQRQNQS